jgi:hypothetical protein
MGLCDMPEKASEKRTAVFLSQDLDSAVSVEVDLDILKQVDMIHRGLRQSLREMSRLFGDLFAADPSTKIHHRRSSIR